MPASACEKYRGALPVGRLADEGGNGVVQDREHGLAVRACNRLPYPGDALVGFDLNQDDGRALVHPLRPVIGLLELAEERRRADGGDVHGETFGSEQTE
jgi:hypothetical protein